MLECRLDSYLGGVPELADEHNLGTAKS
jgi:hypothetical protein